MQGLCNLNDFSEAGSEFLSCAHGVVRRRKGRGKGRGGCSGKREKRGEKSETPRGKSCGL